MKHILLYSNFDKNKKKVQKNSITHWKLAIKITCSLTHRKYISTTFLYSEAVPEEGKSTNLSKK